MFMFTEARTANIALALWWLTDIGSTSVLLFSFCAILG